MFPRLCYCDTLLLLEQRTVHSLLWSTDGLYSHRLCGASLERFFFVQGANQYNLFLRYGPYPYKCASTPRSNYKMNFNLSVYT